MDQPRHPKRAPGTERGLLGQEARSGTGGVTPYRLCLWGLSSGYLSSSGTRATGSESGSESCLANEWPTSDQWHDRRAWRSCHLPGTSLSGWPDLNRRPHRPRTKRAGHESAARRRLRWSQTLSGCGPPRLTAPDDASPLPFPPKVGHDSPGEADHEAVVRLPGDGHFSSRDVTGFSARARYIRRSGRRTDSQAWQSNRARIGRYGTVGNVSPAPY